jgi:hypothetical protein
MTPDGFRWVLDFLGRVAAPIVGAAIGALVSHKITARGGATPREGLPEVNPEDDRRRPRWARSRASLLVLVLAGAFGGIVLDTAGRLVWGVLSRPSLAPVVTNGDYQAFTARTGRSIWPLNDARPVVDVTWNDAVAYCKSQGSHLPSEQEWIEYVTAPIEGLGEWTSTDGQHSEAVVCVAVDIGARRCSSKKSKSNSDSTIGFRCYR